MAGDTPSKWRLANVAEIAADEPNAVVGGPFGSNLVSSDYVGFGVPVIRGKNMASRFVTGEFVYVSEEKAHSLSANLARATDVVFTQRGTLGQVALVPSSPHAKYLISQSQMKLTVDRNKVDPKFVYYLFSSAKLQDYIRRNATQTGVPHINLKTLRSLEVPVPPLEEQTRIADILGSLDDKIELNHRMNKTLEAMARAIFKAWFVDFEPVKAKAAGASSFPGMPQEVFDQLPDRFVESELGPVPAGWNIKKIGEVLEVTMGQSPPSEFYNQQGDGLPFHQGVRDFGYRFPIYRVSCTLEQRIARKGDVLLSVRAPVGRINVANCRLVIGRGLAALRHPMGYTSYSLYLLKNLFSEEDAVGDGTIYRAITKKFLLGMEVISPSSGIVSEVERVLEPLDAQFDKLEKETSSLTTIRDALLPKLISGEIRTPTSKEADDGG